MATKTKTRSAPKAAPSAKAKVASRSGKVVPTHLSWLIDAGKVLKTGDGMPVRVLEMKHHNDQAILSGWAKHFRSQYCDDGQIDDLRSGTGLSRAEYLRKIKFPDPSEAPGPSIRAGNSVRSWWPTT